MGRVCVLAVTVTLAHAWAPFAILPIFVSLDKIDRSLLEAAKDLGEGPVRSFLRVTLPLSIPGIIGVTVSGYILEITGSWALVFQVASGVTLVGLVAFLLLSSGNKIFD